jgi:hypothetical protein
MNRFEGEGKQVALPGRNGFRRDGLLAFATIKQREFLHQAPAGFGYEPKFAGVVAMPGGKHSRLIEKIAIE